MVKSDWHCDLGLSVFESAGVAGSPVESLLVSFELSLLPDGGFPSCGQHFQK